MKSLKGPFTPNVSVKAAMMLEILFSLKTMELLQNGVVNLFLNNSIVFNKNSIAGIFAELSLTLGVNGPTSLRIRIWCKWNHWIKNDSTTNRAALTTISELGFTTKKIFGSLASKIVCQLIYTVCHGIYHHCYSARAYFTRNYSHFGFRFRVAMSESTTGKMAEAPVSPRPRSNSQGELENDLKKVRRSTQAHQILDS